MRSFVYPANLSPEKGGGFTVRFPDLPKAITSGKDRADALLQATDCLEEAVAGRIADGLDVPVPTMARRKHIRVPLPAAMAAKAALYLAIQGVVTMGPGNLGERDWPRMNANRRAGRVMRYQN
jgi:antitoxin HicB